MSKHTTCPVACTPESVRPAAVTKIFTQGDLIQTENELDVAIEGNGFLQVELPNGNTSYTRAGALKRDSEGRIVTSEGYPILPGVSGPSDIEAALAMGLNGALTALLLLSGLPVYVWLRRGSTLPP